MPRYDFHCPECRIDLETDTWDPYSHDPCGTPLQRVYTPPAIAFKGSGFYSTGG